MRNVFLDTNIVIDLLSERAPFYKDAAKIFSLADNQAIKLYCSALSIANIYYIIFRNKSNEHANNALDELLEFLTILPLNEKNIRYSLANSTFSDFEDALQYSTASENRMDIIVTRNTTDFKAVNIPVITSNEFVEYFEN
nr:PIN domain-containing protein [Prolixibacteraceae bacterium]